MRYGDARSQPADGVTDERPFFARFLEALLDRRNEVARDVVSDGAVFKLKAFLHLLGAFGERLKAANDLRSAGRDARRITRDE